MDDLTQRYYEAEMRYLREAGKEFAQAYPDAPLCSISISPARATLMSTSLRRFRLPDGPPAGKLDDDLPELTEGLVSLLWPIICVQSRRCRWWNC